MLQIWLEACRRIGVDKVLINIHAHASMVRDFLAGHDQGLDVEVVQETQLLGSAGTLRANRAWVDSEPCFWVFYADVLHRADLVAMWRSHQSREPVATLGVYRVADPSRCGIVDVAHDGTVERFVEKPAQPSSNLAFAGLLVGTPALFAAIPPTQPVDIGFDVLPQLAGKMLAYRISDYLIDIGTMENYRTAQATWPGLEGELSTSNAARNRV
jgi:mannose-1-phosphate guanylyltransferase